MRTLTELKILLIDLDPSDFACHRKICNILIGLIEYLEHKESPPLKPSSRVLSADGWVLLPKTAVIKIGRTDVGMTWHASPVEVLEVDEFSGSVKLSDDIGWQHVRQGDNRIYVDPVRALDMCQKRTKRSWLPSPPAVPDCGDQDAY